MNLSFELVHLPAVMSADGLGGDALFADAGDLLQDLVSGGPARRGGQGHQEVKHNVHQEIVTHTYQHCGRPIIRYVVIIVSTCYVCNIHTSNL